jgi:hypothetical protein
MNIIMLGELSPRAEQQLQRRQFLQLPGCCVQASIDANFDKARILIKLHLGDFALREHHRGQILQQLEVFCTHLSAAPGKVVKCG